METKCCKCMEDYKYTTDDIEYDESGYGYTTKIVKCPKCGCVKIIEFIEDKSLDINNDERFYIY